MSHHIADAIAEDGTRIALFYLVVTGAVEVAPGRFERGIVSSSSHDSREAAEAEWARVSGPDGWYDEPYETHEIRAQAPLLAEAWPSDDSATGNGRDPR